MLQKMFEFRTTPSTNGIREDSKEDRPDEAKVKAREKEKEKEKAEEENYFFNAWRWVFPGCPFYSLFSMPDIKPFKTTFFSAVAQ